MLSNNGAAIFANTNYETCDVYKLPSDAVLASRAKSYLSKTNHERVFGVEGVLVRLELHVSPETRSLRQKRQNDT